VLEVCDLTVSFGSNRILTDVSFSAAERSSVAVIGPSGSGKSTLLAVIGGLMKPTSGQITFGGTRSTVAWVFQTTNVLSRRSALDNVSLGAVARTGSAVGARRVGLDTLDRLSIGHLAERKAGSLSGGERQRIVIARALAGAPALLLADEPTAQLDRVNAGMVADALIAGSTGGATVIIATHDPSVAERCDTIIDLANQDVRTNS